MMNIMAMAERERSRAVAWCVAASCLAALAGCGQIRARQAAVDPDLQPMVSSAEPQPPVFEPDEVIAAPDAPGAELVGKHVPSHVGPTQQVTLDDEPATGTTINAQPQRTKSGSFMPGIVLAPTGGE